MLHYWQIKKLKDQNADKTGRMGFHVTNEQML